MRSRALVGLPREIDQNELVLPTSTRQPIITLFLVAVVGLGLVTLWAAVAPIARGAVARGHVIDESRRKTIQHLEGGIVSEILIQEGSFVKEGQVLIRLDDSKLKLSYNELQDRSDQNKALIARLQAERDGKTEITFPTDLASRGKSDSGVAAIMEAQERQFEVRKTTETGKDELLRQKIGELNEQIGGMQAQVKSKTAQLKLIAVELGGLKELLAKGLVPKPRVLALERDQEDLGGSRGEAISQIAATQQTITQAQTEIIQNRRNFLEDVVEKLRETTIDELDTGDRMAALREAMGRLEIRSPIDGQIVGLTVHTKGGVIMAGEKLLDVVPVSDRLIIDAQVPPNEINYVHTGLPADVRLSALRQRVTPTLRGTVVSVSSDALSDTTTHQDYYTARVEIPEEQIERLGNARLIAGMPAEVLIKGGDRTVLNYIFAPINDALFKSFRQD